MTQPYLIKNGENAQRPQMLSRSKVDMAKQRIGVWLIGTKGGVATTTIVGLLALQKGLAPATGLVSLLPQFSGLDLPDWSELFIGGHEIRKSPLYHEAQRVATDMRAVNISGNRKNVVPNSMRLMLAFAQVRRAALVRRSPRWPIFRCRPMLQRIIPLLACSA